MKICYIVMNVVSGHKRNWSYHPALLWLQNNQIVRENDDYWQQASLTLTLTLGGAALGGKKTSSEGFGSVAEGWLEVCQWQLASWAPAEKCQDGSTAVQRRGRQGFHVHSIAVFLCIQTDRSTGKTKGINVLVLSDAFIIRSFKQQWK